MTNATKPRRRRGATLLRLLWGVIAAVLVAGLMSPVRADVDDIRPIGKFPYAPPTGVEPGKLPGSIMLNPNHRTGYQIFSMGQPETVVRIFDLDTLKTRREVTVPVIIVPARGAEYIATVDTDADRLIFPYLRAGFFEGVATVSGKTGEYTLLERANSTDPTNSVVREDPEGNPTVCTSNNCLPQVPGLRPSVAAIEYVPPLLTGLTPKILMLWQEGNIPFGETLFSVIWAVQWDIETGGQDWFYRIVACQQRQLPFTDKSQYALTIFQARLGTGIYLGCNANGATGQVVRLTVDAVNRPQSEEAFPGPSNVADVFGDPEDDRVLMRVLNEEGESWWVFNGAASSYSGVVGVTLAPVGTGAGLDPETGRLYVLAPPSQKGGQTSPGGLLISDIRRNPAPQALAFPQYSQPGFSRIVVDPRAPDGKRRVFVRPAQLREYLIYEDNVPITDDPRLTDLDRFTTDVDEDPLTTSSNYTASGHAWGVRLIMAGGLEGAAIPTGPDVSSARVGRSLAKWAGSPCGPQDRKLIVGEVKSASLSNNISNAAATAAEQDPGTGTDVTQPTARCYPYPRPAGQDVFGQIFGEAYPRPLDHDSNTDGTSDVDEVLGTPWPFETAECASEGQASTKTVVRPLNRGPKQVALPNGQKLEGVPKDARDQTVTPQGYRAQVDCRLSKQFVSASADAVQFEVTNLPGIGGTLRVADVSSSSHMYLDAKRGLVSRSVAMVRGINIADRVFIDAAYTVGEAWAHGRPGTAATSFTRRICGVRIPGLKIHADVIDEDLPPTHVGDPVGDAGQQAFPNGIDLPHIDDTLPDRIDVEGVDVGDVDPLDPGTDDVFVDGVDVDACGDPGVPQLGAQPFLDAVNRVLGSRGRASMPNPDGELRQGTPGGYLASIQKDRLQQVGDRAVNNDDSTQVPALQLVLFNDDPTEGRGRQIYQLAGVDASVTYGIFLLNPDDGGDLSDVLGEFFVNPDLPFTVPPFEPEPEPAGAPPAPGGGPVTILYSGISFLLRRPLDALLAAAVWAILFSPAQLVSRRRALRAVE